jgi:hypothetical protein
MAVGHWRFEGMFDYFPEAWDATTGHWGTLVLNDLSLCSATEHFWI